MNLNNPEDWKDEKNLIAHLSSELLHGRLLLVLGAGVSIASGLPNWTDLVNRLCDRCGFERLKPGGNPIQKVGAIRAKCFKGDDKSFLNAVHECLYVGLDFSFEELATKRLLSAIGALAMSSHRGSVSNIVTFNYDDLLELYLEYYGYLTRSISDERHWAGIQDVAIYHPHGLLAVRDDAKNSKNIVFGTRDYMEVINSDYWKPLLQTLLRTHTTLYLGLSGEDDHLQGLLRSMDELHASKDEHLCFHGVFLKGDGAVEENDLEEVLKDLGAMVYQLGSHDEIPSFLFRICQQARTCRAARNA